MRCTEGMTRWRDRPTMDFKAIPVLVEGLIALKCHACRLDGGNGAMR